MCPLKVDSFEFGMGIVFDLVKPFIQQRNTARLPPMVTSKISPVLKMLGENIVDTTAMRKECVDPDLGEKRKRCKICIGNLLASDNNQNKIARVYIRSLRQACGNSVCSAHTVQSCLDCEGI